MNTILPFRVNLNEWAGMESIEVALGSIKRGAVPEEWTEDYILYLYRYLQQCVLCGKAPRWKYEK